MLTQYFAALLATGIVHFCLALIVLLKGLNKRLNQTYALYSLSIALWSIFEAFGITTHNATFALSLWRINHIGVIFIPVFFVHFVFISINIKGNKNKLIPISYAIALFFLILDATPLLILGVVPKFSFRYFINPGFAYYLFFFLWIVWAIYGLIELLNEYFRTSGNKKNQLKYFCWSMLIAYIGGAPNFFPTFNIEIPVLMPFATYAIPIYAFLAAYTILKHDLMDIRVIINRTGAWLLSVGFLGSIYTFLVWLYQSYISDKIDLLFWAWTVLFGILVGHTFQSIRNFIQTGAARKFIKGWYDSDQAIKAISEAMIPVYSQEEAVRAIKEWLGQKLEIDDIVIENSKSQLQLADFLQAEKKITLNRNLPPQIKSGLPASVVLWLPLFSTSGLEIVLGLGKKASESPFDSKDITLLETLQSQAHIVLDRIKPYEEVKEKLITTERQLEQAQRLASLGAVTAGVAHEIRNPLGMIQLAATSLTRDEISTDAGLKAFKEDINQNVKRITNIMQNMLSLAKSKQNIREDIDINKIIEDVLQFFVINNIKVTKNLKPLPKIKANPEELKQVFINLVDNAIHAMGDIGELTISTAQEKNKISIRVSDTGKGISPDDLPKIFDPFFSTRHEGAGLGLSIVYRIVREHGGTIEAASDKGKGTSFLIAFPF